MDMIDSCLAQATEQVSDLLSRHEVANGYVSREVKRLKDVMRLKGQSSESPELPSPHPLELLVRELHNNMRLEEHILYIHIYIYITI